MFRGFLAGVSLILIYWLIREWLRSESSAAFNRALQEQERTGEYIF